MKSEETTSSRRQPAHETNNRQENIFFSLAIAPSSHLARTLVVSGSLTFVYTHTHAHSKDDRQVERGTKIGRNHGQADSRRKRSNQKGDELRLIADILAAHRARAVLLHPFADARRVVLVRASQDAHFLTAAIGFETDGTFGHRGTVGQGRRGRRRETDSHG